MQIISKISRFVGTSVKIICLSHCFFEYVAEVFWCYGPSMEPGIKSHDVLLCEHLTSFFHDYKRGEVVISKSVTDPKQYICKRIVATEGDTVWNGLSYTVVPRNHVWLEGDNRDNSTDSRKYGPIPKGLLKGHVHYKLWPFGPLGPRNKKSWN